MDRKENRPRGSSVALCFLVARPYFGRPWRCPGRNAWHLARRTAGRLPMLHRWGDPGDYRLGLQAAIASIRRYASRVPPVLLLTPEPMAPVPGVDDVILIDPLPFEAAAKCNFYIGGLSAYFKISLYGLEGWDRIIYVDSDTIALGDVSELWDLRRFADKALYAMRETAEMHPWGDALGKLNAGVMVVNAPMLNLRVHAEMLELTRAGRTYDGGDQGILNTFLANHHTQLEAGELPEEYNIFVNDSIEARWPRIRARAKLLHFVGLTKPWNRYYERACPYGRDFKPLWDDAARRANPGVSEAGACSTSA
jgi:hypothetical protein